MPHRNDLAGPIVALGRTLSVLTPSRQATDKASHRRRMTAAGSRRPGSIETP